MKRWSPEDLRAAGKSGNPRPPFGRAPARLSTRPCNPSRERTTDGKPLRMSRPVRRWTGAALPALLCRAGPAPLATSPDRGVARLRRPSHATALLWGPWAPVQKPAGGMADWAPGGGAPRARGSVRVSAMRCLLGLRSGGGGAAEDSTVGACSGWEVTCGALPHEVRGAGSADRLDPVRRPDGALGQVTCFVGRRREIGVAGDAGGARMPTAPPTRVTSEGPCTTSRGDRAGWQARIAGLFSTAHDLARSAGMIPA